MDDILKKFLDTDFDLIEWIKNGSDDESSGSDDESSEDSSESTFNCQNPDRGTETI